MVVPLTRSGSREHEVHRFYQPWLETFRKDEPDSPNLSETSREDGYIPRSSNDKALTAFAQLGCLRVRAKRGVVTLIDGSFQYILAEATKSISLMDDSYHVEGDELWLGNAILPRGQGVSEDALHPAMYTALGSNGSSHTSPALVISDIAADDRYKARRYAGSGVSFYAGVPVVTNAGYPIGVYTVSDDKPRDGLTLDEFRFMTDMAMIVAQHLEYIKNNKARARGTKLVRGIGTFMQGKFEGAVDSAHHGYSPDESLGATLEKVLESPVVGKARGIREMKKVRVKPFKGMTISSANLHGSSAPLSSKPSRTISSITQPTELSKLAASAQSHSEHVPGGFVDDRPGDGLNQDGRHTEQNSRMPLRVASGYITIFERAANILCDCMSSDGVAFLDASCANLSQGTNRSGPIDIAGTFMKRGKRDENNVLHDVRPEEAPASFLSTENRNEVIPGSTGFPYPKANDPTSDLAANGDQPQDAQFCEVLAVKFRTEQEKRQICLSEPEMRQLIQRYPEGKHYSFDEFGSMTSADELNGPEAGPPNLLMFLNNVGDGPGPEESINEPEDPSKNVLLKALPHVRNIVFLPLWDLAREKWNSALIIWSTSPAVLANVHDDLSYLTAFANSVTNEIARLDLPVSEKAKTRFLANISHELRSPLHGILGSIEFLHDTAMDDFQSNLVIAVETCSKTLLDTVNHVLDYSKIRSFIKQDQSERAKSMQGRILDASDTNRDLIEDFNLAAIVEESVEAVYAGQVFRNMNTNVFHTEMTSRLSSGRTKRDAQSIKDNAALGSKMTRASVSLILDIDFEDSWDVVSQPGALRRIVMNLLGNALKYTETGSIGVTLQVDKSRKQDSYLHACLTVSDTGKGMSEDFLRNHAFTAFSQENPLASGTGLGLSIVRQIVDSLGGKIDLRSQEDIGTEIKIWLSLPRARDVPIQASEDSGAILRHVQNKLQNSSICLLRPKMQELFKENTRRSLAPVLDIYQSLEDLVVHWFKAKPLVATEMKETLADYFMYAEPPSIEYLLEQHSQKKGGVETPIVILCTNAFEAASLRASGLDSLHDLGRIIEIIPQPCGPQKLAKVLHRCLLRKQSLKALPDGVSSSKTAKLSVNMKTDLVEPTFVSTTSQNQFASRAPSEDTFEDIMVRNQTLVGEEIVPGKQRHISDLASKKSSEGYNETETSEKTLPRVLVVDDNPINLQLLVTFVRKSDHPYASAVNGLEAFESYKQNITDVTASRFKYVLMDISMPIMDGMRSCREIRAFEKANLVHPPAIIIALTGLGSENAQEDAYAAGFDHFMSKPVKFKELLRLLT